MEQVWILVSTDGGDWKHRPHSQLEAVFSSEEKAKKEAAARNHNVDTEEPWFYVVEGPFEVR